MGLDFIVNVAFQVYDWLIFIRIILSWIRHNPYQPVIRFIYEVTEPVLGFFRRIIPPLGVIDISPIAAFFALELLRQLVVGLIRSVGL
ncbi:YggT family protein [Desulfurispora thermophila]|uniref:YggT family protein n=1 Tax=Desulfurispora thermophila TaxID=265470 RepID=UPI00038251FD|nr:YggT family protein [Desulfurispora thermophila]